MTDDKRLQQIKARCARRQTEVLLVNGRGEIDFAPTFRPAEIDPDIPWLLEQLEGEQARNENFSDCFRRGLQLYLDAHPGAEYWPDGAANIAWLFEELEAARKVVVDLQVGVEWLTGWLEKISNVKAREGVEYCVQLADKALGGPP